MSTIRAAIVSEDITPRPGVRLSGFAGRTGPNEGWRDLIRATALYLSANGQEALVIGLDVIGISAADDLRLRTLLSRHLGLDPDTIMVACSHTHSGPATMEIRATGAMERAWTDTVFEWAIQAAAGAQQEATTVSIAVGEAECTASVNRRRPTKRGIVMAPYPDGPTDPVCRVVRLDSTDGPIAVVVQYAMHPTTLGKSNRRVSADWIAPMRKKLEAEAHCPVLFLQGCCGDVSPRVQGGEDACVQSGVEVADAAIRALRSATSTSLASLGTGSAIAAIPLQPIVADAELCRVEAECRALLQGSTADKLDADIALGRLEWVGACRKRRASGMEQRVLDARVSAIGIGPVTIVGLPGEVFTEIGDRIRAEAPGTWPIGYTNGNVGYLYPDTALVEGGYEVDLAWQLYGEQQPAAGAADALVAAALDAVACG